ncbi:MAG: DNA repair protein RadA [Desulfatibacillaceae bacterium]|nr:DNA repair protein RadA [Desulfatibacillaceae bacterium]
MVNKAAKSFFACQECGYKSPKWLGKCPDCGQWHSLVEEEALPPEGEGRRHGQWGADEEPMPLSYVSEADHPRLPTGINEFDRVLGGGLVAGSVVLIGGDPGIGKSTLMLQAMMRLCQKGASVLYVSGEESVRQIKLRSGRVGSASEKLFVVCETLYERIAAMIEKLKPAVLVLDSIQTLYSSAIGSAPGSIAQVREVTFQMTVMAKKTGIPTLVVGHVTKDGAIAGPRLLEHMVDTVLYFEGDRNHIFRILRAVKNRFGSTNEIGVFEMRESGLAQVENPSAVFLAERPEAAPGSVVTASMEGSRPILVEIQALASPTSFASPRRTVLGLDANRVALLAAVLEKRCGMPLGGQDLFMNVAGGVRLAEPAVDLAVVAAMAGSFLDRPLPGNTLVLGEVGLTGEIRGVGHMENRLREAAKMGFSRCVGPLAAAKKIKVPGTIKLECAKGVANALEILF